MRTHYAWVSIGTDGHPIGICWYKENLQNNVKRVRVKLIFPKKKKKSSTAVDSSKGKG